MNKINIETRGHVDQVVERMDSLAKINYFREHGWEREFQRGVGLEQFRKSCDEDRKALSIKYANLMDNRTGTTTQKKRQAMTFTRERTAEEKAIDEVEATAFTAGYLCPNRKQINRADIRDAALAKHGSIDMIEYDPGKTDIVAVNSPARIVSPYTAEADWGPSRKVTYDFSGLNHCPYIKSVFDGQEQPTHCATAEECRIGK